MATIRPFDLPPASSVSNIDAIVVDDGIEVRKATASQVVANAVQFASQAQVEVGTDQTTYMNPLRTAEAIAAQAVLPATLSSNAGAGLIGTTSGQTVQQLFDDINAPNFTIGCYINPPLNDAEQLLAYTFVDAVEFDANFPNSRGCAIDLPLAPISYEIYKVADGDPVSSAVLVGNVLYSGLADFTFTTVGAVPVPFAAGDTMIVQAPATADTAATCTFTLLGAR